MHLKNVSHSFDPRGIAGVHQLNLKIAQGEILCLIGASGAGKTTLLRLLHGDIQPMQGEILIDGKVSFMGMSLSTNFAGSLQEWLVGAITKNISDEQKIQWARDLADVFEFPMQLKKKLAELSEGQRQRARLAFALINQPELLLLDEPFAHLDRPLCEQLNALLVEYVRRRSMSVVWVTHEVREALSLSDRLAVMDFGRIVQLDTPENVFTKPVSLVVAQLVGLRNFVTLERRDPKAHWSTPFGLWDAQGVGAYKTHLLLSIPPRHFKLDSQGPFKGTVKSVKFMGYHYEVELESQGQVWLASFEKGVSDHFKMGESRQFSVELKGSIGIDCLS